MLWGDGTPTREFLYVDDCVEGLLLAGERVRRRRSGQPRHRRRDLDPRSRRNGRRASPASTGEIVWDTSMPNGQPRRSLDASRAEELFGFRAPTALREGRARTVAVSRARASACRRLDAARHPPPGRVTVSAPGSTRSSPRPRGSTPARASCSPGSSRSSGWPRSRSPLTVRHNGWVYYQGGDQIWYTTTALRLLGDGLPPPTYDRFRLAPLPLVPLG